MANTISGEWIVVGDLNLTLNAWEKKSVGCFNSSEAEKIKQILHIASLEDLGCVGYKFTWSNRREDTGLTEARLDRGLENAIFFGQHKNASIKHMVASCLDIITTTWKKPVTWSNAYRIVQKLSTRKKKNRIWNKHSFGDIRFNINKSKFNLKKAISNPITNNRSEIKQCEENLSKWYKVEEKFWKDKSGEQEIQLGDRNTHYFYKKTQKRWRRNRIEAIKDNQGNWVEGKERISSVITDHFSKVASTSNPSPCDNYLNMVHEVLNQDDNDMLTQPPNLEELRKVVFSMKSDSSLGWMVSLLDSFKRTGSWLKMICLTW
ncbi:uncharacterized protein LOC113334104 [Papaver somniferum]|uniref:uncharacterized protein LOC113334104 n=1 Tax=Papaver somniferum TaxID=3469 RepID=UPI000E6F528F|nr:uncharacterized protein LOC113334104 [Papaver somniferum]